MTTLENALAAVLVKMRDCAKHDRAQAAESLRLAVRLGIKHDTHNELCRDRAQYEQSAWRLEQLADRIEQALPALSAEELEALDWYDAACRSGVTEAMDEARDAVNAVALACLRRIASAAKPVEGADQRPFIAAEMYRLVDGMKASEDISEVAERLEKLAGHLAKQNNPIPAAVQVPTMPGNWPEDASHENGDYECRCVTCKQTFYGHKRRVVCKVCASPNAAVRVDERQWPKSCDALGIARCDHPNSCGCSRANAEAELLPVLRHYVTDAIANDRLGDHAEINGSVLARIDAALAHKESK